MNDQLQKVALPTGSIEIYHKSMMGNLSTLIKTGNAQRILDGKTSMNITMLLASKSTKEYINTIALNQGISPDHVIYETGAGRTSIKYANLHLMVFIAEKLSPQFHYDVIDTFINGKLLELRDMGGEDFKDVNTAIDAYLPEREGKSNQGIYIQISLIVRGKVFPNNNWDSKTQGNIWNSTLATCEKLKYRDDILSSLLEYLKMGFIKDWNHLKEIINKL